MKENADTHIRRIHRCIKSHYCGSTPGIVRTIKPSWVSSGKLDYRANKGSEPGFSEVALAYDLAPQAVPQQQNQKFETHIVYETGFPRLSLQGFCFQVRKMKQDNNRLCSTRPTEANRY